MKLTLFQTRITFILSFGFFVIFYTLRLYPLQPVCPYDTHYLIFPFETLENHTNCIPLCLLYTWSLCNSINHMMNKPLDSGVELVLYIDKLTCLYLGQHYSN